MQRKKKSEGEESKVYIYSVEATAPPILTPPSQDEQEEAKKRQQRINNLQFNLSVEREQATNAESWSRANYNNSYATQLRGNAILNGMMELRLALNIPRVESNEDEDKSDPANQGKLKLTSVFDTEEERNILKKKYAELMDIYVRIMKGEDPNNFKKNETQNGDKGIPDSKGSG